MHWWLRSLLIGIPAGLGLTLAMPPIGWWPLLFLAIPLFWQHCRLAQKKRHAITIGIATGFIHYLSSLSWITGAVEIGGEQFAALVPVALIGIPTALSLYLGITALLIQQAQRRFGTTVCWLISPVIWFAIEYSRLFGLPFPWLPLGTVWMAGLPMAQLASVVGVYGLSLLTFLMASSVALWWRRWPVLISIGLLLGQYGFGEYRLRTQPELPAGKTNIRLVQPNIQQQLKWAPGQQQANLDTLIDLSLRDTDAKKPVDLIIWPESSFPGDLATATAFREQLAALVQTPLVIGSNRWVDRQTAYNSLFLLADNGEVAATYDKHQLVPFGEYIPFRWLLNMTTIAGQQTGSMGDFSRGPGPKTIRPQTITSNNIPAFSPLICYEGIFSGQVVGETRPNWLLNITNDGWYGDTLGPYQHAAMVRLRGIEEGLPVVRVANTGISFVSNRFGHHLAHLPYDEQSVLDVPLNTNEAATKPTVFSIVGNKIPGILALILLLLAAIPRRSKRV